MTTMFSDNTDNLIGQKIYNLIFIITFTANKMKKFH